MRAIGFLSLAIFAALFNPDPGQAQTLMSDTGPAEYPPADFTASQYVDSRGCVYIRAGYAGTVEWVPRVNRARQLVCGHRPSLGGTAATTDDVIAKAPPAQIRSRPAATVVSRAARPERPSAIDAARAGLVCGERAITAARYLPSGRLEVHCRAERRWQGTANRQSASYDQNADTAGRPMVFSIPKGYQPAWQDGRLNPYRGKGTAQGAAAMDRVWTRTVPRRLVSDGHGGGGNVTARLTQPYATGLTTPTGPRASSKGLPQGTGRYVQVGAFGQAPNSRAAEARLRRLGLPVRVSEAKVGGKLLQVVMAGPFADQAKVETALAAVRKAGFADAFVRR